MNLILHFLLAHFLADYPFQSGKLVKLKMERYLGVFVHGLIHLITLLVVLYPVLHLRRVQIAIAIIYFTHNLIDQMKVKLDKKDPKHHRLFYFTDQLLHNTILLSVAFYIGIGVPQLSTQWFSLYTNPILVAYVLLMVLSTYFYDVTRHFFLLKGNEPYVRDYKVMMRNAVLVTVIFAGYWWLF